MAFRNVLIADDEESMRHLLTVFLRDHGYEARAVANGEEALRELSARDYDLVLSDVRMPRMDGLALLREAQRAQPELTFIVMSAYGSHEAALEAMKAGAYDYVSKPFKPDEVLLVLRKAEERQRLWRENRRLRTELAREYRVDGMVGEAPAMVELLKQVQKLAPVKTTVLVTGESGTGKELIARALHERSPRAALAFVPVNCGALPAELMESELFGHVKGAFTDAGRDKKGLAAEADGGTLFLDEIGELPLGLQVKLLRFLQDEEVRPVGGTRAERVDVRVVAATSRDLRAAVAAGEFREDLWYRLDVVELRVPPLRERAADIPALARHFLARFAALRPSPLHGFSDDALAALAAWRWPGNVRELEHAVERAAVLAEGPLVQEDDLPEVVRGGPSPGAAAVEPSGPSLSVKLATRALEEALIRKALAQTGGNRTRAAALLELSYRALLYKIKEYGISA